MINLPSIRAIVMAMIVIILGNIISTFDYETKNDRVVNSDTKLLASYKEFNKFDYETEYELVEKYNSSKVEVVDVIIPEEEVDLSDKYPEIVYEGMTLEQLGEKLDKNLKSTLSGYGLVIAKYSIEYDVNPYMAEAIILHETGCGNGSCSGLVKRCNNVGGMKGGPSCGNGSYKRFNTLDEGIKSFVRNLSNNYIKKGLKTPEQINTRYAESNAWAGKVKYYMNKIENN